MEKIIAKDKKHLKQLIKEAIEKWGNCCDLNHIDLCEIKDLSFLFNASDFNGNISEWDVSHVENMEGMFSVSSFNGDLSKWNVSRVENMSYMFWNSSFSQEIFMWDISNVRDFTWIFEECNVPKPWWYIEDDEKRKEAIEMRKELIGLKEKISSKIKNKEENNVIVNRRLKI